jgi:hypothetical protein
LDHDPRAIDDYIRENNTKYNAQAIREQLIAAGHDPSAVDEAMSRADLGRRIYGQHGSESSRPGSGLVGLAWALFAVGGVVGLVGLAMAMSFGSSGGLALPIFGIAYVGIGLGLVTLLRWAIPRFGIGGVWASLIGLALFPIFGALMFGTCVAAFGIGRG